MTEQENTGAGSMERELSGLQEMLYFVLDAVGSPVVVTKKRLKEGIRGDQMISVEENMDDESFIFSIIDIASVTDEQ